MNLAGDSEQTTMIHQNFDDFFQTAMGLKPGSMPYPYQRRFATEPELRQMIRAPTGAGKTAAIILGWLWRYHHAPSQVKDTTPRRLIYCLPMRVLVEQSAREAQAWVKRLGIHIPIVVLMGGAERVEWFLRPEEPAILIGTQDMLLSRALNRGYGASRFHWPIDFGLLNNDCLWAFDEPQLMGSGVSTSAQLAGLRAALTTFGPCPSVWMSATLEPGWLDTIDFAARRSGEPLELGDDDYDPNRPLFRRMTATKTLRSLGVTATRDGKEVARLVVEHHVSGTQTLVVLNTVDRAKAVYAAVTKDKQAPKVEPLLLHSRFRPNERETLNTRLTQSVPDRIIIATQVVEAGVDISARTLITELAPWASIVQRIGRCNRTGDDGPGTVLWIDLDIEKLAPPYETGDLRFAREQLAKLDGQDVSPKALDDFKLKEAITLPFAHTQVLRRRDLIDLFDTAPDLSGNDIDITRFIRSDDPDTDVQVFWRHLAETAPSSDHPAPDRRELCNVPVGAIKAFLEKGDKRVGFVWDHLDEEWKQVRDPRHEVRPGVTILLPSSAGGYSKFGWDADSSTLVDPVEAKSPPIPEGTGSDPNSCGPPLTIAEHTDNVCEELGRLLESLPVLLDSWSERLRVSARWHDAGKAHGAFQYGLRNANPSLAQGTLWAKSGTNGRLRHRRKHFRHELASALVGLQHGLPFEVAYLIAAHHGRIRLNIRTLPDEVPEHEPDNLIANGVEHGDQMPSVELGGSQTSPKLTLDLSPMRLGGKDSWTARALAIRDTLGPFRLAYLEALLRAADVRASRDEQKKGGDDHA